MLAPFWYGKAERLHYAQGDELVIDFSRVITDLKYSSPVHKDNLCS